MKIEKTVWDERKFLTSPGADFTDDNGSQPGFELGILWNTGDILKPCLVVRFWNWRLQLGWLVDGPA